MIIDKYQKTEQQLDFVIHSCKHSVMDDNLLRNLLIMLAENLLNLYKPEENRKQQKKYKRIQEEYQISKQVEQQKKRRKLQENKKSVMLEAFQQIKIFSQEKQMKNEDKSMSLREKLNKQIEGHYLHKISSQKIQKQQKIQTPKPIIITEPRYLYTPILTFRPVSPFKWLDQKCYYYNDVQKGFNTMVARNFVTLFSKIIAPLNKKCQFNILSNGTGSCLGFIDRQHRDKKYMPTGCSSLHYRSDGFCWDGVNGLEDKGRGFKNGQTVTMTVDRSTGEVEWKVGKQLRHSCFNKELMRNDIEWVPYIIISHERDSVSLFE